MIMLIRPRKPICSAIATASTLEKFQLLLCDYPAHIRGKMFLHLIQGPGGVQEERATRLDALKNIVHRDIDRVVAGNEIRVMG